MNESYIRGFMSKCAECGVSKELATQLIKKAWPEMLSKSKAKFEDYMARSGQGWGFVDAAYSRERAKRREEEAERRRELPTKPFSKDLLTLPPFNSDLKSRPVPMPEPKSNPVEMPHFQDRSAPMPGTKPEPDWAKNLPEYMRNDLFPKGPKPV